MNLIVIIRRPDIGGVEYRSYGNRFNLHIRESDDDATVKVISVNDEFVIWCYNGYNINQTELQKSIIKNDIHTTLVIEVTRGRRNLQLTKYYYTNNRQGGDL